MSERPSRRHATSPACLSWVRWKDRVGAGRPMPSAIWPAGRPSGPAWTSSRKMPSRDSWASASSGTTASLISIFPNIWKYNLNVKPGVAQHYRSSLLFHGAVVLHLGGGRLRHAAYHGVAVQAAAVVQMRAGADDAVLVAAPRRFHANPFAFGRAVQDDADVGIDGVQRRMARHHADGAGEIRHAGGALQGRERPPGKQLRRHAHPYRHGLARPLG